MVAGAVGLRFGAPIYRQHTAIREIERLGGTADFARVRPRWLRKWFSDERMRLFDEIGHIRLEKTHATDASLRQISGLRSLTWLDLDSTHVTDSGLAQLRGLSSLKWLELENTAITDVGLAHLKDIPNLELVMLGNTHVTRTGAHSLMHGHPKLCHVVNGP